MKKIEENERLYIQMLQDLSNRMATNSMSCMTWLLSTSTAFFVAVYCNKNLVSALWVLYIPCLGFWFLSSLYLSKTRKFLRMQSDFITEIKNTTSSQDTQTADVSQELDKTIFSFKLSSKTQCSPAKYFFRSLFSLYTCVIPLLITGIVTIFIWLDFVGDRTSNSDKQLDSLNEISCQGKTIIKDLDSMSVKMDSLNSILKDIDFKKKQPNNVSETEGKSQR